MSNANNAKVIARGALYWVIQNGNTKGTFENRDDAYRLANRYRDRDQYVPARCQGGWARKADVDAGHFEAVA